MEDTILYSSCFDANGGLFETLLDEHDCVISDALNHASIIDGIRLCKARRLRYANNDLNELEQALKDSQDARVRLIATDGVFSMDGSIAQLKEICDLAERYSALVMVDDSHATGFIGANGRGSHELRGVHGPHRHPHRHLRQGAGRRQRRLRRGTQGNRRLAAAALAARICSPTALRRRSPPPPSRCSTCWRARRNCASNCTPTRAISASSMQALGFDLMPGEHPIIPVMLGEAPLAVQLAERMQARRRLCGGLLLSGRAPWKSANSHPNECRAHDARSSIKSSRHSAVAARDSASFIRRTLMKALVKARAEPGIWMQDVPEPKVGHNDVLIKIHRSAICGTDMHIYNWDAWAQKTVPVPMAVGHEYAGEIVEIGSEVRGFKTGDRVSGEGHITCGHCRNCRAGRRHLCRNTSGVGVNRPGAFAEYLTIPASQCVQAAGGHRR